MLLSIAKKRLNPSRSVTQKAPYRLAVVATHPIQYHAPWFRAMQADGRLNVEVFFCHKASGADQAGAGFGVEFEWDVPLLDGYKYKFLQNVARKPSGVTFGGIDTPEIAQVIAEGKYDAVLVNGWNCKAYWQTIMACWRTGTPVMVRGDSHLHTERSFLKAAAKWVPYRCFIPRFDACLAVGKWSREYYEHYGAKADRVFFVPHAVDEVRIQANATELIPRRMELRKQFGLTPDTTVFMFAGKFTPQKRPVDVVHAIKLAASRSGGIEGLMVGDGPLRGQCGEIAQGDPVAIRFAGFLNQSRMPEAYLASDVIIVPGVETWGMVVNEAMLCGALCIVSDRVGCGPDLIGGGGGWIYPLGDVAALSEIMVSVAKRREVFEDAKSAIAATMQTYSLRTAVNGVVEAISAIQR